MAPSKNKPLVTRSSIASKMKLRLKTICNKDFIKKILTDPHHIGPTCVLLLIFETILNVFIIEKVKYTEIDWIAYMQEVEGFLNGTLDYKHLKGDTGPLVYPAGFVYVYSAFYFITSRGSNIYLAQYIFLIFYLIQTYLLHRIIRKTLKLPPYALIITTLTSYRIHSIFVLRLFNDPIAVLLVYISLNLFISNKWALGSLFYSLAVSIKMNALLYAPALLIAYLTNLSLYETFINLFICGITQLLLGLPFLYGNFYSYLKGSFDFGRVFEHKWTVNFRFLSRDTFENPVFHLFLLSLHIFLLLLFTPFFLKYYQSYAKLFVVTDELKSHFKFQKQEKKDTEKLTTKQKKFLDSFENQLKARSNQLDDNKQPVEDDFKFEDKMSKITQLFVLPFFVANFIGIVCARSLHYQFYSWYYHSLLYLSFSTGYSKPFSFLLLGLIEYCWNIYPSTNLSSQLLHFCHISLLYGLYRTMKC